MLDPDVLFGFRLRLVDLVAKQPEICRSRPLGYGPQSPGVPGPFAGPPSSIVIQTSIRPHDRSARTAPFGSRINAAARTSPLLVVTNSVHGNAGRAASTGLAAAPASSVVTRIPLTQTSTGMVVLFDTWSGSDAAVGDDTVEGEGGTETVSVVASVATLGEAVFGGVGPGVTAAHALKTNSAISAPAPCKRLIDLRRSCTLTSAKARQCGHQRSRR